MTLTEIKKALYKEKPMAEFICAKKERLFYGTILQDNFTILFEIPFSDIGDATFVSQMSAQLLIRYIVQPETRSYARRIL